MKTAVAIVSGGLDSVTLAHYLAKTLDYRLRLLSFDYGQRHGVELVFASRQAKLLGAEYQVVDLRTIQPLLPGSALTDDVAVPHGHYEAESMSQTVVPGRNAMMLSIAWAWAAATRAQVVACGVHAGDHHIYPDCRPEFIASLGRALALGTESHADPQLRLIAPFVDKSKADIVRLGADLGVDYAGTWTCYEGQDLHCGQCGSCVERREAFVLAGVVDPTAYKEGR